jgi:hypothetical protein
VFILLESLFSTKKHQPTLGINQTSPNPYRQISSVYPRSGTYYNYPQNNFSYGVNMVYNRPNYSVTAPAIPYVAETALNYGENANYNRPNYGGTAPAVPNIGSTPIYFREATNVFRPDDEAVPPTTPNVGEASVIFGQATSPNRPIYYPTPTTYDVGNYPAPAVNSNPITYAPQMYPKGNNTSALQPLSAGGSEQFNPYTSSIPAEQSVLSTPPRSASYSDMSQAQTSMMSSSEIDELLADTNTLITQGHQVKLFSQEYTVQEEQRRQQEALLKQQQYRPPDLTKQHYQQSQAISNAYQQRQPVQGQGNIFQKALAHVLKAEGGYSDHPSDTGGKTMKGITQGEYNRYLKKKGQSSKSVKDISQVEMEDIYYNDYWKASGSDQIATSNQALAMVHFDTTVNMGLGRSKELLAKSGGDANKYLELREQKYREFASKGSQRVFLKGWLNRNASLRQAVAQA